MTVAQDPSRPTRHPRLSPPKSRDGGASPRNPTALQGKCPGAYASSGAASPDGSNQTTARGVVGAWWHDSMPRPAGYTCGSWESPDLVRHLPEDLSGVQRASHHHYLQGECSAEALLEVRHGSFSDSRTHHQRLCVARSRGTESTFGGHAPKAGRTHRRMGAWAHPGQR